LCQPKENAESTPYSGWSGLAKINMFLLISVVIFVFYDTKGTATFAKLLPKPQKSAETTST